MSFDYIVAQLGYSHPDGTIPKLRNKITNLDLLILDDFALSPLKKQELTDLFEITEDRSAMSSVIMISQRPAVDWYSHQGVELGNRIQGSTQRLHSSHGLCDRNIVRTITRKSGVSMASRYP